MRLAPASATGRKLMPIPFQTMMQPGSRRYDWIEFGKTNGRPCLSSCRLTTA